MKKILVTGSEGYIGCELVTQLLSKGYSVTGLDTCYYGTSPRNNRFLIKKDIRDINEQDLIDIDAVIHLAALSNDPIGELDSKLTEEINFRTSIKIAKLAKKVGVSRFIFSSSCSVYGKSAEDTVDETSQINPITAYAISKVKTENQLQTLADSSFFVGILRNATVYGYSHMFRNDLVVNDFVSTALAYKEIRIKSDGTAWRPLIDVRDLSDIFIKFLETQNLEINGKVINIGFNENNFQIKDILDIVSNQIPNCKIVYTKEHGADTRSYKVGFNRLKNFFPDLCQNWRLNKSISNMISTLVSQGYDKSIYESKKYIRIEVLKKLQNINKLNHNLQWI